MVNKSIAFAFLITLPALFCSPTTATAQPPTVAHVFQLLKSKDVSGARAAAVELDNAVANGNSVEDSTTVLALVARTIEQSGNSKEATELYRRAVAAVRRAKTTQLKPNQVMAVYLAAGANFAREGHAKESIDAIRQVMQDSNRLSDQQLGNVTKLLLLLGSESLSSRQPKVAASAYRLAALHGAESSRATASLGHCWALSMQPDQQSEAASHLFDFAQAYPDHPDGADAAMLCIRCARASDKVDLAKKAEVHLLKTWPDSHGAQDLMQEFAKVPHTRIWKSGKDWLLRQSTPQKIGGLDQSLLVPSLLVSLDAGEDDLANKIVLHIASVDKGGSLTFDFLNRMNEFKRYSEAERMVALLIAPSDDLVIEPLAREIACQWAVGQQLWSMLALASESSDPQTPEASRTATVERIYAEALMQSGRHAAAKEWWDHLVDTAGADDFPTLLRCAETAVALDGIQTASMRVHAARVAAGKSPKQLALTNMLAAELAVRSLDFDEARRTLQSVVQSKDCPKSLRARAQWTIGETYYMQRNFAKAIGAYRGVESIDRGGQWIAVALVQAGKSFEQLGRTQEAAVCYSTLVKNYADGPYADAARKRLALISPESSPSNDTIRR